MRLILYVVYRRVFDPSNQLRVTSLTLVMGFQASCYTLGFRTVSVRPGARTQVIWASAIRFAASPKCFGVLCHCGSFCTNIHQVCVFHGEVPATGSQTGFSLSRILLLSEKVPTGRMRYSELPQASAINCLFREETCSHNST